MLTNSKQQPEITFFLDRTQGRKVMAELLRRVGLNIQVHHDHFAPDADDDVWIAACGKQNWVIITGDKGVEKVPFNRQAAIDSKAKVFILTDTNSRAEEWASAIILGRHKILQLVRNHNGPFFATIGKASEQHISELRFADDGGPIKAHKRQQAAVGNSPKEPASKRLPSDPVPAPAPAPPALF